MAGRRRGDGRDATAVPSPPGAVSARRPSASAAAQQQQRKRDRADDRQSRHRRQVRDDRELHRRRTRVAGAVLRGPAAMSTVTVPEAAGVVVAM